MLEFEARKCPCKHVACEDWHVYPVAAVQGVKFTEEQAKLVAETLNKATWNFPDYMDNTEKEIVGTLLDAIFQIDVSVDVSDEEECVLRQSRDRRLIEDYTCNTDMTVYVIYDHTTRKRLGHFALVHGNGKDVISDFSANAYCDSIWAIIQKKHFEQAA